MISFVLFLLLFLTGCDGQNEASQDTQAVAEVVKEMPQSPEVKIVPDSREQITLSFAPVVKQVAPSVVNVFARKLGEGEAEHENPFASDPFFKQFMKRKHLRGKPEKSLGSGVIVSADGIIITNYHVIKPEDEIRVVLHDKREYFAKVVLVDRQTDLAALRIDLEGEELPFMELSDDEDLEVGDLVLAIGNPYGVGQTVTSGIISALSRSQKGISKLRSYIQTDAAINPGNSGGALVTTDGRLVGINTAIYSKNGGSVGIGFAIPSVLAIPVLKSAKEGLPVQRPWSGLNLQPVSMNIAETLGLEAPQGALVKGIYPGSPGDKAGLQVGDLITEINGDTVDDEADFDFEVAVMPLGSTAEITVLRKGQLMKLPLEMQPPQQDKKASPTSLRPRSPLQGAFVQTLKPGLAMSLGLSPHERGVVIMDFAKKAPAQRMQFQKGDVILKVNDVKVASVDELLKALGKRGRKWKIALRRGQKVVNIEIHEKSRPPCSRAPEVMSWLPSLIVCALRTSLRWWGKIIFWPQANPWRGCWKVVTCHH